MIFKHKIYKNNKPDFLIFARINRSGFGMRGSTDYRILEQKDIAALII
jgi:hypothetical protein